MKLLVLASLLCSATAQYWKGMNVGANNPDGSCKSQADWYSVFTTLQGLPGGYNSVRLYATSDCDTLANAVPAAISTGMKILVGVWTQDRAHFDREKGALEWALGRYGSDWILAVSVGSEDLYRKETSAARIAEQIYDVRGMINYLGHPKQVGHVDTWTAWVDPANRDVITACDFVGMNGFPYWQGATIPQSSDVFWKSYDDTKRAVDSVKPGIWIWMTETGWPVTGDSFGASVPSRSNAQQFYKIVACEAFKRGHVFWYAYQDYTSNPSFGVVDANRNPIYDLSC
ncbi:glycoside hydrolase family 17 protein [Patellaria atrata CBS 101060]|uniref:Probable glucan endo-1,3-beta-glucosidase eglC n=1 Tax=Patellaria atrata CBS 101060 TaxID=1346257 RepID=A0A9P4S1J6_9PEZI|nr:glycoside hydrolase family 17 protein [Patellaria atrata CBS 101060]